MNRITAGAYSYTWRRRGGHRRSMKVAAIWLIVLIFFTLINICIIMASWYGTSTATSSPADLLSGRPLITVSNSSVTHEIKHLRDEIASLKQEFKQQAKIRWDRTDMRETELEILRNDFSEQVQNLYRKIRGPPKLNDDGQVIYKVHLWDDKSRKSDSSIYGYREKKLYSKEGFSTHPQTTLVDKPEDADIIVWVTVRGNIKKEIPPRDFHNVLVLDYGGMQ